MATKKKITIETFEDFKAKLQEVIDSGTGIIISYYRYCNNHTKKGIKHYKRFIHYELDPLGLEPYKISKDFTLFFKFKDIAEAVIQPKKYNVNILVYKY